MLLMVYRDIVLNNWLLNPTGGRQNFVEADLMQEHFNFWIKVRICYMFYQHVIYHIFRTTIGRMAAMLLGSGSLPSHLVFRYFVSLHQMLIQLSALSRDKSMQNQTSLMI
jgi:hypothetical protein